MNLKSQFLYLNHSHLKARLVKFKAEVKFGEIVLKIPLDSSEPQILKRRLHDLRAALRTFEMCVQNLNDGYQFDDNLAEAKLKALSKASKTINTEFRLVESIFHELLHQAK